MTNQDNTYHHPISWTRTSKGMKIYHVAGMQVLSYREALQVARELDKAYTINSSHKNHDTVD